MLPVYLNVSFFIGKTRELNQLISQISYSSSRIIDFCRINLECLEEDDEEVGGVRWNGSNKTSKQCILSQHWNYTFLGLAL